MAEEERDEGLDSSTIAALALGVVAWVSFVLALFMADDPFLFLLLALVTGVTALVLGVRARRAEAAAVAVGATAAGAALLYGVTLAAALAALVYATGVLLLFVLFFFLFVMFAGPPRSSGGGCTGPSCDGCCTRDPGGGGCCNCCDQGSCCDCGSGSCCSCGSGSCCDCGCGDCGGCDCGGCGGCGGCACAGLAVVPRVAQHAPPGLGLRERVARVLRTGLAHHPDLPECAADVYVVRGARWCIGCFTTYPAFVVAFAGLLLWSPAWPVALVAGAALAALQGVSSAGLARTRALKMAVKTSLGLGLALLVWGVHEAPWLPAAKVAALAGLLGLAWLSAVPRARRMAKRHERCACATTAPEAR